MDIIVGGDFYAGSRWEDKILIEPSSIWSEEILNYFKDADYRIINLESPLTNSENAIEKIGPSLRCDPKVIDTLKVSNIDLVTLANNHIYDYGEEGFDETLKILKSNNIDHIGVGKNINDASYNFKVIDDIVFLNYCHNEWGMAKDNKSGYNSYSIIDIVNQIKFLKNEGKFVVLILHRGHELYVYPSPQMVKEFHHFIENGADLIITHHSHFYSGFEKYKHGHIFYGLGNLLFDSNIKNWRWYEGIILKLKIEEKKLVDFEVRPVTNYLKDGNIRFKRNTKIFKKDFELINKTIKKNLLLNKQWENYTDEIKLAYLIKLHNKSKYWLSITKRIGFFKRFLLKRLNRNKNSYRNLVSCEAHNEVLKKVLES